MNVIMAVRRPTNPPDIPTSPPGTNQQPEFARIIQCRRPTIMFFWSNNIQKGPWKPENLNLNLKFQVQVKSSLTIISFKFSSLNLEELENYKSSQVWKVKNLTWLEIYYDQICWWLLEEWGMFHWMKESNWHGKKMSSNLLSNQPRKDLIL